MELFGEYHLSDKIFLQFSKLIQEKAGIFLSSEKKTLLHSRLIKTLRQRKIESFEKYLEIVRCDEDGDELTLLLDSISTNVTSFFREEKHFQLITETFLPKWMENIRKLKSEPVLRCWSAGCSTGEEPYTLAMVLSHHLDTFPANIRILATDLSTKVLKTAIQGIYSQEKILSVPPILKQKYLQKNMSGQVLIQEELRNLITFRQFNLKDHFPFKNQFDLIFCRNVMIYFPPEFQKKLIQKFSKVLAPGGLFFVGHSESLTRHPHNLRYLAPSVYQK